VIETDLPEGVIVAVARAVEAAGGDMDDVDDLLAVWQRQAADKRGKVERMRYEAANPRCSCADGGVANGGDRCERCYALRPTA
jgi:hypothetical protein